MTFEKLENIAIVLAAMATVALSGPLSVPVAFAQTKPAVELQAAITKEQVDGDIKTAMAAYQKIASDKSVARDVRAKALLHLAGCYEKLGQQAQNIYQQIVREFADQPAATQARARLAVLKRNDRPAVATTMTQRKIETLGPQMGPGDTDGHLAAYRNAATGDLIYGDIAGHSKRVIFKAKPEDPMGWFPSRDFSVVGLQPLKPDKANILAVINTNGTGYREVARLDGPSLCGPHWSWDNRYVLCSQPPQDANRLLRISVADGQIRELVSLKTGTVIAATFSPDGRYVAYQVLPPDDADPVSGIFVLPAEGGEPQLVYEERRAIGSYRWLQSLRLLDWTADGRYLAVGSQRKGNGALYLLPIKDGKSAGAPVFVKYGDFEEGVTTAAGGLVYKSIKAGGVWAVNIASFDSNSRPGDWKRLDLNLGNIWGNPTPRWSGNGNQIVYVVGNEDAGQSGGKIVHLHDLSTGGDREIYHSHDYTYCTWAVQQPKIFCADPGPEKAEILSIAVDSGEITRLGALAGSPMLIVHPSRDDRALYILRVYGPAESNELLRWEIATGQETILERFPAGSFGLVSSDERWQFRMGKHGIDIRPIAGGDWKLLVSLGKSTGEFNATPDGNWLLYHGVDAAGKNSLFRVATAGGPPERLGDLPTTSPSGSLEISPDGRQIMISAGEYANDYEFWSLENFVPPAPKP